MQFSIIMPCYNRRERIDPAIKSILEQDLHDASYELIIVDDGSVDGTADYLKKQYGDAIKLIQQQNAGPGAARNRGIQEAVGEYVCFLDSDDQWFPWTLSTFKRLMEDHNSPAFISSRPRVYRDRISCGDYPFVELNASAYNCFYASCGEHYWLIPGASCVRRKELLEAGCFTDQHINAEDTDLWLKLGAASGFVWLEEPALLAYCDAEGSAAKNIDKTVRGILHIIHSEVDRGYPGGNDLKAGRRRIILTHTRAASIGAVRIHAIKSALEIYRKTFTWNLCDMRFRYLAAFPFYAIFKLLVQ